MNRKDIKLGAVLRSQHGHLVEVCSVGPHTAHIQSLTDNTRGTHSLETIERMFELNTVSLNPEIAETLQRPDPPAREQATKHDSGKECRPELIPAELITAVGTILAFGAAKYAPRNWEKGMSWSRVYGALMRHLWAWFNPLESDLDPETGKSHLWHAGCCVAFLIAYEARGIGEDDRK